MPTLKEMYDNAYDKGYSGRKRPYRVTFALDLFNGPEERGTSRASLDIMLRNLFEIDALYLRTHPQAPLLYKSGVRYMEEPPGQEDWQDIPTTIRLGIGDCLPLSTNVLRADGTKAPLASLKVGDMIMGDGRMTTVLEVCATGKKPILEFYLGQLEKGKTRHPPKARWLRCSPEHRLIMKDGEEVRAKDVQIGRDLMTLENPGRVMTIRGREGHTEGCVEECGDIKTDIGRFYLPDEDVVVHNCEDLAYWRAAELNVRFGIAAKPIFREQKRANGSYLYHILVLYPEGYRPRIEDPSRNLGMR